MVDAFYDWRGNKYSDNTPIFREYRGIKIPVMCEMKNCGNQAVRNRCMAEGGFRRTHWAGWVHVKNKGPTYLCAEHGELENRRWLAV